MELLQWYLASIIIYFVVIIVLIEFCADKIEANGWLDDCAPDSDDDENPYTALLLICSVPILRFMQCVTIIVMAAMTKEEYEKLEDED